MSLVAVPEPYNDDNLAESPESPELAELAAQIAPIAPADQQLFELAPDLCQALGVGGLRKGSVLALSGWGSRSLAFGFAAEANQRGSWCAVVDLSSPGWASALGSGLVADRLVVVVGVEPQLWVRVVSACLDSFAVVICQPPPRLPRQLARQVDVRVRQRKAVLLVLGVWPGDADIEVSTQAVHWCGIGRGHGYLQHCEIGFSFTDRRRGARQVVAKFERGA